MALTGAVSSAYRHDVRALGARAHPALHRVVHCVVWPVDRSAIFGPALLSHVWDAKMLRTRKGDMAIIMASRHAMFGRTG